MLALAALAAGCAASEAQIATVTNATLQESALRKASNVEVAELEISYDGVDRFTDCAPPGELGQSWIPPLPAWSPPRPTEAAPASPFLTDRDAAVARVPRSERGPARTERLFAATRFDFKRCYDAARFADPTQDGRAAIVLRVGADGHVAEAETYGACVLSRAALRCMKASTMSLRFDPPEGGQDTVVVPVVYGRPTAARAPTPNDVYANTAYLTLEGARRELHTCESGARTTRNDPHARGAITLTLDPRGHVAHAAIEPISGNTSLLQCAARVLDGLVFAPPPAGSGSVLVRVAFNPQG